MRSMTGFGAGRATAEAGTVTVQIAAVNHRHCQVHVRGDLRDLGLEEQVRRTVRERLTRGSITVQIGYQADAGLALDLDGLAAAWRDLATLAAEIGAPVPALEHVARLRTAPAGPDLDQLRPALDLAADQALTALERMRADEGAALQRAFLDQIATLRALRASMATVAAARLPSWRERLEQRLRDVVRERAAIDDEVLVRELAIYADRADVDEEMVRITSHLDQLTILVDAQGGIGKKLDFLLQELSREINTTGSKAGDAELTGLVVDAKHLLEQMREQAANVL